MRHARSLALIVVLVVVSAVLAACAAESTPGWTFAPTPTPTAAPPAPASGAPSGAPATPAPSGAATPAPSGSPGAPGVVTLTLTASGVAFDKDALEVPANTDFQIVLVNNDAGIPHNVAIHQGSPTGPELFKGEGISGIATITYTVKGLPPGTYGFVCTYHPNMTGTLTVK